MGSWGRMEQVQSHYIITTLNCTACTAIVKYLSFSGLYNFCLINYLHFFRQVYAVEDDSSRGVESASTCGLLVCRARGDG